MHSDNDFGQWCEWKVGSAPTRFTSSSCGGNTLKHCKHFGISGGPKHLQIPGTTHSFPTGKVPWGKPVKTV